MDPAPALLFVVFVGNLLVARTDSKTLRVRLCHRVTGTLEPSSRGMQIDWSIADYSPSTPSLENSTDHSHYLKYAQTTCCVSLSVLCSFRINNFPSRDCRVSSWHFPPRHVAAQSLKCNPGSLKHALCFKFAWVGLQGPRNREKT